MRNADEVVRDIVKADEDRVSTRKLVREISRVFGGADGLARELHNTYCVSPEGSQNRARILSDIVRLWTANSEGDDDLGEDIESLEAETEGLMKDVLDGNG